MATVCALVAGGGAAEEGEILIDEPLGQEARQPVEEMPAPGRRLV
jgi:hypothetical protein